VAKMAIFAKKCQNQGFWLKMPKIGIFGVF